MIRALARFAVNNPVPVNLATLTVAAAGVFAYLSMPREVFPNFSLGTITVTTVYPGAAPEDVERLVTLPVEDQLGGIEGRRKMTSTSQEGYSLVTLTAHPKADMSRMLEDVRAALQSGDLELPDDVDDPVVDEIRSEFPAIAVFVYGYESEDMLRRIAEDTKRGLEKITGVSQVILQGQRVPRVWIEVDPLALESYGLTLDDVGRAVRGRTSDRPLGRLETESGDYLMRVDAGVSKADDLRDLLVIHRPDGTAVRLEEIARLSDTYERRAVRSRFMGRPSIYLRVNKGARGDAIQITRDAYELLEELRAELPSGVGLGTNSDLSIYVRNRLKVMKNSAFVGGVLVLISLILFLNLRIACMTALGIPLAFLGGLVLASGIGLTMNMLTMFALIVVLGMIVDDAIVVGENAYRLMEEGLSPAEAAIQGVAEVGKPVMATIFTTIAAFLPMLLIGGTMGQFMRPLPLIVSFCLIASLLEALLVLPAHLAHWTGRVRAPGVEGKSDRRWYEPLRDLYVRVLAFCVRWRYPTVVLVFTGIALLAGFAAYRIPLVLFDDFESKVFSVNVRTLTGTSLAETDDVVQELDKRIFDLPENELDSTNSVAGVSYVDASQFTVAQNLGQVWVELREDAGNRRPTSEIIEDLRTRFLDDPPPKVESLDITQPQAGPTGRAIDVSIRGPDMALLSEVADDLKAFLATFRGVRDIHDNARRGKREVRLRVSDEGRLLGFDEDSLSRELRTAFEGLRYGRLRRGNDDVEIIVKLPEDLRGRRSVLEHVLISLPGPPPNGEGEVRHCVPLAMVCELQERTGPARISRDDGERSISVRADVNKAEGNTGRITAAIERRYSDLALRYPGISMEFQGEAEDAAESFAGLRVSLVLALFLIYMILGSLFQSLVKPLAVMAAIPFGAVGMILGHAWMDRPLSFMSLIGFVALTGIVVNDSLILLDFVNQRRAAGMKLMESLIVAGRQRFRPILLTSVTTMLGLTPLTLFASGQARFLQPMAITIFFGLLFSTSLILVVIPCTYAILEDLMVLLRHPATTIRALVDGEIVHDRDPKLQGPPASLSSSEA